MKLPTLNELLPELARESLERCCGSRAWVNGMIAERPFTDRAVLHAAAERVGLDLQRADWLEAFGHHPRIGESALREKFSSTAVWAGAEQHGAAGVAAEVIEALAAANRAYEERFGYVFIVCATGKRADEMLAILEARLANDPPTELATAAAEQLKITHLRLDKLLEES